MIRKVTAALIKKNDTYLIARRNEGGSQGGRWEFPGGKVDEGETPWEALKRELFEELEIQTEVGELVASQYFRNGDNEYELMVYETFYLSGEFVLHEHQEIRWERPECFGNFNFSPSDWAVIMKLFPV